MTHYLIIALTVCVALVGAGVVQADKCTFTASSGNWDSASNWSCLAGGQQVPTAADLVIIDTGNTCTVNVSNAVADRIDVKSTATLNIGTGNSNKLTLDNDDDTDSTIDGTLNLDGSDSVLQINDNDHTFNGSGTIVGKDNDAEISIAVGKELLSGANMTIEGKLKITGAGRFKNNGFIHANTSGTILIDTVRIKDQSTAFWKISGSSSAVLQFDSGFGQVELLSGSFRIDTGTLDVDGKGFTSDGKIDMRGGSIDVAAGAIATFNGLF